MTNLTIEDFEITQLICTLDFERQIELMDKRGFFLKIYMDEFPIWDLSDPLALHMKSTSGNQTISINFNMAQWGYALQSDSNVDQFIIQTIKYMRSFCETVNIHQFNRVGLRILFNLKLEKIDVKPPEFPRLADYFDFPGVQDIRLSDLIHYQVSTQSEGKRDVLIFGQSRESSQYFLRPDLNSHDYGDISAEHVESILRSAYRRLISRFQKYLK